MTAFIFIAALLASPPDMFTIRAEVTESITLNAEHVSVREYLANPDVFRRHFPGIIDIRQINNAQSEWTYEVKAPLSSARRTSYIVNRRYSDKNAVLFETDPGSNDYMYCRASVAAVTDTTTTLLLELRLHSSREHASEIHFLAPLFGEKFISARMRDQLTSDITSFFKRISDELHSFNKFSRRE